MPEQNFGLLRRVRACLFDLDGVITKTAELHAKAWKRLFDGYLRTHAAATRQPFVAFDAVRDYDQYVDGKPREEGTRSFLRSRGIELPEGSENDPPTAETVHQLAMRKDGIFAELLHQEGVHVYPGSRQYVQSAKKAGLRTAVVSSSRHCAEVLAAAGIADLFEVRIDGIVAAREHLRGKPAPDTYLRAARALDVPPDQAAIFEDALAGVEAGRAGGFGVVVGVDRVGQADALKRSGADVVVTDLANLLSVP